VVTSHELAEGVTDPNGSGWCDSDPASSTYREEKGRFASIDGYIVRCESSAAFSASMASLYDTSWLGAASYSPFIKFRRGYRFLSSSNDPAVDHQRCSAVMIEGRDAQDRGHALS
jgi:hypothetical protein